ncbi:hypothetical protein HAX54_031973 [Datura stramonium]|uniref:phosphogluconate dehydrogenase (NADP(+)-dependent, decarboxylating) n=1 Tax=Datura stramonium TaxID=4076 RepID=A0ABS8VA05_DATST|nr:hypothetical protein [Datura stramonium]
MGQNLARPLLEKGFMSVYNRSTSKKSFVLSIQKPRVIIILVKAGLPVDQTIKTLSAYMEKGDCIIDGGNEWYENTERREKEMAELGLLYLGMGVSGGEEAQVPDSGPCVTYIGKGGSGNFVKMVHNGIEYGDMQLIAEAYDVLVNGLFSKLLNCRHCCTHNIASLDSRFLSGLKDERVQAAKVFESSGVSDILVEQSVDKNQLIEDELTGFEGWLYYPCYIGSDQGAMTENPDLANLLVDEEFAKEMVERQRESLPANLVQAQRDYFGAHTYERIDVPGAFHTEWF